MALFADRPPLKRAPKESFSQRVVKLALSIPKGRVSTYGALAKAAGGGAMAAQSVTAVLAKAWDAGEKEIPFHRIVYADGRIWVNETHRNKRMALYKKEGIKIGSDDRIINFADVVYTF